MSFFDNSFAMVFPGQGSQSVGMGRDFAKTSSRVAEMFSQMDQEAGFSLSALMFEGDAALLSETINTQPALFTHSLASFMEFRALTGKMPAYVAGHSLGQLSASVAAGSLPFSDGLKLVFTRARLMKQAGEKNPGSMAAILGLDINALEAVCKDASGDGKVVQVANDNCQGQVVISGHKEAVDAACLAAKAAGAKRALPLAVSIAAHSLLMDSIQKEWNSAVDSFAFVSPKIPVIGNVGASPLVSAEDIRNDLKSQMQSRVRWTESILWLKGNNICNYIETGNGAVLAGLIKRIDPDALVMPASTPDEVSAIV